ncbi:hypothetical protein [Antarctobacter heliothermus]|uniref:Uncharacterized protein n=1 Tax=Antarctobacter heliothermus TaxID=74033 RepID=A0A239BAE1_9RHOB|nr:hypothetical protein [Antarctobacter heliothermus]SNS04114.1 hypothetical protein SAMN04488078_1002142 [Antarctobacter heliothermus]
MRLALLTSLVILASQAPAETVGRFGVHAVLPGGYTLDPPPDNDDGRVFTYDDGAEIVLWGSWPMAPMDRERADTRGYYLSDGAQITYDAAGAGWFVLSGFEDEIIFYLRVEEGHTCGGETALAHLELRYPVTRRAHYDPQVAGIAGSLGFGPC